MKSTFEKPGQVPHEQIAQLAKDIWEREGRQVGRDLDYWLQAERELLAGRNGIGSISHNLNTQSSSTEEGPDATTRVIHI